MNQIIIDFSNNFLHLRLRPKPQLRSRLIGTTEPQRNNRYTLSGTIGTPDCVIGCILAIGTSPAAQSVHHSRTIAIPPAEPSLRPEQKHRIPLSLRKMIWWSSNAVTLSASIINKKGIINQYSYSDWTSSISSGNPMHNVYLREHS